MAKKLGLASRDTGPRDFLLRMLPTTSVGAEIGVHKGGFSVQILRIVKPTKLHLIDPWNYEQADEYKDALYGGKSKGGQAEMDKRFDDVRSRFSSHIEAGQVVVHRGYSSDVSKEFPDGYFDWVYIDGNHLYEFVIKDLEQYYEKVKSGGLITGDDYTERGWWKGSVKKAVDEFVSSSPVELIEIRNRQFILRKIS